MDVEVIKRAITEQESEIREKFEKERIVEREPEGLAKYLRHPNVLAVLGVRRAGKSMFSILVAKKLAGNYAYVNFDDPDLGEMKATELKRVLEAIYQLKGDTDLIILDEIHNIPSWELFVTRLRERKRVIITGSNSKMLSSDLATRLTGRYMDFILFPFSFREYLLYKDFSPNIYETKGIAGTKSLLRDYMGEGGFPESQKFGGKIIGKIYDDILKKDIILKHDIRFVSSFKEMAKLAITNFSNEISYNKLKNVLDIRSVHTVKNYMDYLEEAFLLFRLERYSPKLKQQVIAPKKVYLMDHGISKMSFRVSENYGKLMENVVAVELLRKRSYKEMPYEIFYWRDYQQNEVDFVIKDGVGVRELIQVCYDVDDFKTKEREVKSLLKASKELGCKNLVVITGDYEGEERANRSGAGGRIRFIPLWKWLLAPDAGSKRM